MTGSSGSAWLPLRNGTFRVLWLAVFASNVGLWMQTVGAQWLLVHRTDAAILVPLVQVADTLPDLLFGLVGGVLADIFDRRRLLIVVQIGMAAVCVTLTVLTRAGHMPPAVLLGFTFVLGSGSVLTGPAYQSLVPDLVSRSEIPAAASLGSVNVNLARAVGPAIAGVLISLTGVSGVFALDAATPSSSTHSSWPSGRSPPGRRAPIPDRFSSHSPRERATSATRRSCGGCSCGPRSS